MSWLNLNQSLNNIKGQISSFASEVLSEGIVEDRDPFSEITKANDRINELQALCASQEVEIASLRRRNSELQHNKSDQPVTVNGNASDKDDEGSWFWDPPPEGGVEDATHAAQISSLEAEVSALKEETKKRKEQYERTIKELGAELTHAKDGGDCKGDCKKGKESLEGEVKRLNDENKGLVNDLEDLDSQHQAAMDKLLDLKKELQKSFEVLKADHEKLKLLNVELVADIEEMNSKNSILQMQDDDAQEKINKLMSDLETLQHKYVNLEKVHRILTEDAEKFQEDNQELQEDNSKLQDECTGLQEALNELRKIETVPKNVFQKMQADYERLKDNMAVSIMSNNEDAVDSNNIDDNAKSVIENLKREITELQNKLTGNDDIKRLIGENNVCKVRIDDLENQLQSIQQRHEETLAGFLEKYINFDLPTDFVGQRSESSENSVIFNIESALRTLSEYRRQKEQIEHELSQSRKTISELQSQIEDISSENELINADLAHYEHEASEMKKNNDFLIAEIGTLRNASKLHPISESHEESLVKLESELEDCSRLNKSFETEIEIIEKELGEVRNERDKLMEELADLKSKYQHMSQQLDIYQNETNACETFDKQKDVLIFEIQSKLKESQADVQKLKMQLQNVIIENEKRKIDFTILDNEKILLLNEISELKAHTQSQSILNDYVKDCEDEKIILEQKVKDISFNLDQALGEKMLLEADLRNLKDALTEQERNYESLVYSIEATDHDRVILDNNKKAGEKELSAVKSLVKAVEEERDRFKLEVAKLQDRLNNEETYKLELQRKLETLNAEFKVISDANADMESDLLELRQNKTDNELALMHEKNLSYRNEISELQRQNVTLKAKFEELNLSVESIKQEIFAKNVVIETEKQTSSELILKLEHALRELSTNEEILQRLTEESISKDVFKTTQEKLNLAERQLRETEATLAETRQNIYTLESALKEKEEKITKTENSKEELIKLVTLKHGESISYHNEIQRLNVVLVEKDEELHGLISQVADSRLQDGASVEVPEELKSKLSELELRCEGLLAQLHQEQEKLRLAILDKNKIAEREHQASRELTRLRSHLAELEEDYTRELVQAEQKNVELTGKLSSIEEQAKKSSTVYTSNSIRANQEVETIRNQLRLVQVQRDDIQARLDRSEDKNSSLGAALTNLQLVLEQFQLDKERDVTAATAKLRAELADETRAREDLKTEIAWLNDRLLESSNGLKAASRLGGQLEAKNAQLTEMREQVLKLQTEVKVADEKYRNAIGNQQDRVDKSLVKNLLLGFVQASNQQRHKDRGQVLKILSSVLDFNQSECERAGLSNGRGPPGSQGESLTQEFIKFLEKESRPSQLPTMLGLTSPSSGQGSRPSTPSSRTDSAAGHPELHSRKHSRNVSAGSQNLLFQSLDVPETEQHSPSNALLDAAPPARLVLGVDPGVTQTRNTEGAILKNVLKDV